MTENHLKWTKWLKVTGNDRKCQQKAEQDLPNDWKW